MRIKKEIRASESSWEGRVIVADCVSIEQFSRIIGVITGLLQPNRHPSFVESLTDEFGISTFEMISILLGDRANSSKMYKDSPYGGFTSVTLVL